MEPECGMTDVFVRGGRDTRNARAQREKKERVRTWGESSQGNQGLWGKSNMLAP